RGPAWPRERRPRRHAHTGPRRPRRARARRPAGRPRGRLAALVRRERIERLTTRFAPAGQLAKAGRRRRLAGRRRVVLLVRLAAHRVMGGGGDGTVELGDRGMGTAARSYVVEAWVTDALGDAFAVRVAAPERLFVGPASIPKDILRRAALEVAREEVARH